MLRKEPAVATHRAVQTVAQQSHIEILRLTGGPGRTLDRHLYLSDLTLVRVGDVLPVLRKQRRQTAGLSERLVATARRLGQRYGNERLSSAVHVLDRLAAPDLGGRHGDHDPRAAVG